MAQLDVGPTGDQAVVGSLKGPRQDASNKYTQHKFSWRIKKNNSYFWLKKFLSSVNVIYMYAKSSMLDILVSKFLF